MALLSEQQLKQFASYSGVIQEGMQCDEAENIFRNIKKQTLKFFTDKIISEENFSIVKFGDGEFFTMTTTDGSGHNCDGNQYFRELGNDLLESYVYFLNQKDVYICRWANNHKVENELLQSFYIANPEKFIFYNLMNNILPISDELKNFYKTIQTSKREKVYISHSINGNFVNGFLKIDKFVELPNTNSYLYKAQIINKVLPNINRNSLVLISGGMASKVFIKHMHEYMPEATYLDIGSALDGFLNRKNRVWNQIPNYYEDLINAYKDML